MMVPDFCQSKLRYSLSHWTIFSVLYIKKAQKFTGRKTVMQYRKCAESYTGANATLILYT